TIPTRTRADRRSPARDGRRATGDGGRPAPLPRPPWDGESSRTTPAPAPPPPVGRRGSRWPPAARWARPVPAGPAGPAPAPRAGRGGPGGRRPRRRPRGRPGPWLPPAGAPA